MTGDLVYMLSYLGEVEVQDYKKDILSNSSDQNRKRIF